MVTWRRHAEGFAQPRDTTAVHDGQPLCPGDDDDDDDDGDDDDVDVDDNDDDGVAITDTLTSVALTK